MPARIKAADSQLRKHRRYELTNMNVELKTAAWRRTHGVVLRAEEGEGRVLVRAALLRRRLGRRLLLGLALALSDSGCGGSSGGGRWAALGRGSSGAGGRSHRGRAVLQGDRSLHQPLPLQPQNSARRMQAVREGSLWHPLRAAAHQPVHKTMTALVDHEH